MSMYERMVAAEAEVARLQHVIDCGNTPLMRDVMGERDRYKVALEHIVTIGVAVDIGPTCHWHQECAEAARSALSGRSYNPKRYAETSLDGSADGMAD